MGLNKRMKVYFYCAFIMLTVFSLTFLIMPFPNIMEGLVRRVMLGIIGSIFWFSGIIGYLFLFLAKSMERRLKKEAEKEIGKKTEKEGEQDIEKKWYEKFHIYENRPISIADTFFIAAAAVLFILHFSKSQALYIAYIALFVLIFSFNIHLLFGGNLYKAAFRKELGKLRDEEFYNHL